MVDDLINEIQNRNIPVSVILLKAKVIATKRKDTDFQKWLDLELNGYKVGNNKPPQYRELNGQAKFWNPMLGWCPIVFHNTQVEDHIINRSTNQSIAELEQILETDSHEFEMPYPASVAEQIMQGELRTKVSLFVSRSSIVGVLNRVRNIVLDWVLNLDYKGLEEEKPIIFTDNTDEKLKFDLSFSLKQAIIFFTCVDGKQYEVKVQGQVQKEVLRVIFQNPQDTYTTWSLYDISEILGQQDVNEKAVHNAIYQFNKKVKSEIPELKNLFNLTKHSVKINTKYTDKT